MYEYKVIPAPAKGRKAPGVKGAEARFAHALELVMNERAADGWEFQRADILPSEERQGLTSTQTVYRSVLIFRRPKDTDVLHETSTDDADVEADEAGVSDEELDTVEDVDMADDNDSPVENTRESEKSDTEKA